MDVFSAISACFCGSNSQLFQEKLSTKFPPIILDTYKIGQDVIILKDGRRICGRGAALCTLPILQDKAYFEVKVQQEGIWGVGLSCQGEDLNKVPLGDSQFSWVLRSTCEIWHNSSLILKIHQTIDEQDVIGVTFDHELLSFYLNSQFIGDSSHLAQTFKGTIFPAVYVENGAIIDVSFSNFSYSPPLGFHEIMVEQSII